MRDSVLVDGLHAEPVQSLTEPWQMLAVVSCWFYDGSQWVRVESAYVPAPDERVGT